MVLNIPAAFALLPLMLLLACARPVEDCVAKKQAAYRKANPNANYAAGSTANEKFREECEARQRR